MHLHILSIKSSQVAFLSNYQINCFLPPELSLFEMKTTFVLLVCLFLIIVTGLYCTSLQIFWQTFNNQVQYALHIQANLTDKSHKLMWNKKPMLLIIRAGHVTILPRQRDYGFRTQSCLLLQYNYICCGYSIQTPKPKYFSNFFWSLMLSYNVAFSQS